MSEEQPSQQTFQASLATIAYPVVIGFGASWTIVTIERSVRAVPGLELAGNERFLNFAISVVFVNAIVMILMAIMVLGMIGLPQIPKRLAWVGLVVALPVGLSVLWPLNTLMQEGWIDWVAVGVGIAGALIGGGVFGLLAGLATALRGGWIGLPLGLLVLQSEMEAVIVQGGIFQTTIESGVLLAALTLGFAVTLALVAILSSRLIYSLLLRTTLARAGVAAGRIATGLLVWTLLAALVAVLHQWPAWGAVAYSLLAALLGAAVGALYAYLRPEAQGSGGGQSVTMQPDGG